MLYLMNTSPSPVLPHLLLLKFFSSYLPLALMPASCSSRSSSAPSFTLAPPNTTVCHVTSDLTNTLPLTLNPKP